MQTFKLKLLPLPPPRKLSTEALPYSLDCPSKDRSEDTTVDEEGEIFSKEIELLKEQIEHWDEEYRSAVFHSYYIKRQSKKIQIAIDQQSSRLNESTTNLHKLQEEYNKLSDIPNAPLENNSQGNKTVISEKEIKQVTHERSLQIKQMYGIGNNI